MSIAISPPLSHEGLGSGRRRSDRLAGRLALAGASLGVLAGLLELTIGPSVRDWVGDKQDTTRLGLTTVILSAVALAAAAALVRQRGDMGGRRVLLVLGLLIPAIVCFTTVGRLWYLPGALLLAAGGLVLGGTRRQDFAAALDERHWRIGLLVLCGAFYIFLGATALGLAGVLGIVGGALIWAVVRAASRSPRMAYALLLGGALPFAARGGASSRRSSRSWPSSSAMASSSTHAWFVFPAAIHGRYRPRRRGRADARIALRADSATRSARPLR